jgi:glycosyltransferase involved in cell wall biosynthesis
VADVEGLSVALVGRFFDPHPAGAEVNTRRVGQALVQAGVPCEVVTTRASSERPRFAVERGLRVRRLRSIRGPLSQPVDFGRAFAYLLRHGGRFSIVQTDCLSAFSLGAILGGRVRGARTIVGTCNAEPDGDISRILRAPAGGTIWRLFRRADVMVAWVPAIVADLQRFGVSRRRVVQLPRIVPVGPEGPSTAARRTAARTALGLADRPSVLYVGRLTEAKGVDVLLEAWSKVTVSATATLLLVGDGPLAERARTAASTDPGASIVVAGVRDDVERWFDAADLFAFPSRSETFGLALAEAMGRGVAVVATPTGFVRDGFEDGVHGKVVPAGDATALAAALDALMADDEARTRLGVAAHAYAAERFAAARALDAHLALYRRLIAQPPS